MSRNVLLQILGGTRTSHALRRWINLWPPFLGAGIRVKRIAPDMKAVDVEMKLRWWNANYVGTHFGGSLFAMTDAFYMLMLMTQLGRDYIVWDKAATIRYKKPGRGKVRAEFRLSDAQIEDIREEPAEIRAGVSSSGERRGRSRDLRSRKDFVCTQEGFSAAPVAERRKSSAHGLSCGQISKSKKQA
jgi:acyl-coenzyme A thioesterase PaaI-like protein